MIETAIHSITHSATFAWGCLKPSQATSATAGRIIPVQPLPGVPHECLTYNTMQTIDKVISFQSHAIGCEVLD